MVAGLGGLYQGWVVDDADPLQECRLRVLVPEVFAEEPVWAVPSLPVEAGFALPAVDEVVSVSFEKGNSDHPVWEYATDRGQATRGYLGKYQGVVIDVDDPLYQRRLRVVVPEISEQSAWAVAADGAGDDAGVPSLGSAVWIEYEQGDPERPRWVGLPEASEGI